MILSSRDFENENWIPKECTGFGADCSPELIITDSPENAVCFAITMGDLGHPIEPGFNHWVAWNISPVEVIPKGIPHGECVEKPIHIEQELFGKFQKRHK